METNSVGTVTLLVFSANELADAGGNVALHARLQATFCSRSIRLIGSSRGASTVAACHCIRVGDDASRACRPEPAARMPIYDNRASIAIYNGRAQPDACLQVG
jgi:hypothetical protein